MKTIVHIIWAAVHENNIIVNSEVGIPHLPLVLQDFRLIQTDARKLLEV